MVLSARGRDRVCAKTADSHGGWRLQTGLLLSFGTGCSAGILSRLCSSREKCVPVTERFLMSLL